MLAIGAARYLNEHNLVEFDESGVSGNAFVDYLPSSPDLAVGIYSGGGAAPDVKTQLSRPSLQFLTRGTRDPRTAQELAQLIWSAFHGLTNTTLPDGTIVRLAKCNQSEPVYIGTDEAGRHRYSVNVSFITRR